MYPLSAGQKRAILIMPSCRSFARQQWPLLMVATTAGLALVNPGLGAKGGVLQYDTVVPTLIVLVFLVIGATVPLEQLWEGTFALNFHIVCQLYSLIVLPVVYYVVVYQWGWEVSMGILSPDFAMGVMATLCMPTTGFTCVMFARQGGGDESVAVCNAALGNILGPIVAPITAHYTMHSSSRSMGQKVTKLILQLIVPLVMGAMLQHTIRRTGEKELYRMQKAARYFFNIVLATILYYIFCEGFASGAHQMSAASVATMVAWVACVHIAAFFGGYLYTACFGMSLKRRVTLMFVGSQKTEGMAIAILAIISANSGVLTLPVVAYHSVQMAFAAAVAPHIRHYVAQHEGGLPMDWGEEDDEDEDESGSDEDVYRPLARRGTSPLSEHGAIASIRRMRNSARSAGSYTM